MSEQQAPPKAPRISRTLKFSFRALWDTLGLVCAASLTLFVAVSLPLSIFVSGIRQHNYRTAIFVLVSLLLVVLVVSPIYGGVCWLAHKVFTRDEPCYLDLWSGARTLFARSVVLGSLHSLVAAVLISNIVFYLTHGTLVSLLFAILFLYALVFWGINSLYHWPLLIANAARVVKKEDGGKPGLTSILRNGFLMAISAPVYTLSVTCFLTIAVGVLAGSGLGMALLGGGMAAYVSTQATRDQLIRFGVIPAEPEPDEEVVEEAWKLK